MSFVVLIVILASVSGGCLSYAVIRPYLTGAAQAQRRQSAVSRASGQGHVRSVDAAKRRRAIADSLKEVAASSKGRRFDVAARLAQAGLSWSPTSFWVRSAIFGALSGGADYLYKGDVLLAFAIAFAATVLLPLWALSFLAKRRVKKFLESFPDAIDVIIRGIKAGLPVADCFRMIASESPEPLRSEFRRIVEAQSIGLTVGESVEKLAVRIPLPETSFFAIVVNIQQKSGGNLSEALSNLASVLRGRKRMREKVRAVSSEAKASAGIIGSLPFILGGLVYFINPAYIMLLFTTTLGYVILGVSFVWMAIGVIIMRAMINFDI